MDEKLFEIDMLLIRGSGDSGYTIECVSRRGKTMILKFPEVEGIEIEAPLGLEVRTAYMSCGPAGDRVWNMKFSTAANLRITYSGKVYIRVI